MTNPQLIAVTDNVNQSKGDQGPEDWKPPLSESGSICVGSGMLMRDSELLLHLRQDVGKGEERVLVDDYECGEERFDEHAEHVLRDRWKGERFRESGRKRLRERDNRIHRSRRVMNFELNY